jgi:hypothetical protein
VQMACAFAFGMAPSDIWYGFPSAYQRILTCPLTIRSVGRGNSRVGLGMISPVKECPKHFFWVVTWTNYLDGESYHRKRKTRKPFGLRVLRLASPRGLEPNWSQNRGSVRSWTPRCKSWTGSVISWTL